jgi:uncharacterized RDD family membrane protein YckC
MEQEILDSPEKSDLQPAYAGFWLRFVAYLIDGLVLSIPSLLIYQTIGGGLIQPNPLAQTLVAVIGVSYFAFFESSEKQATLGKQALGIIVTDLRGERISFAMAVGRYFSKIISALILLIGFIMAGFTEKKQALHDMIAGTLVIKKKNY